MDHLDLTLEQNGPPVRMAGFAVLSLRTNDFQGEQGQTGACWCLEYSGLSCVCPSARCHNACRDRGLRCLREDEEPRQTQLVLGQNHVGTHMKDELEAETLIRGLEGQGDIRTHISLLLL